MSAGWERIRLWRVSWVAIVLVAGVLVGGCGGTGPRDSSSQGAADAPDLDQEAALCDGFHHLDEDTQVAWARKNYPGNEANAAGIASFIDDVCRRAENSRTPQRLSSMPPAVEKYVLTTWIDSNIEGCWRTGNPNDPTTHSECLDPGGKPIRQAEGSPQPGEDADASQAPEVEFQKCGEGTLMQGKVTVREAKIAHATCDEAGPVVSEFLVAALTGRRTDVDIDGWVCSTDDADEQRVECHRDDGAILRWRYVETSG